MLQSALRSRIYEYIFICLWLCVHVLSRVIRDIKGHELRVIAGNYGMMKGEDTWEFEGKTGNGGNNVIKVN